MLFVNNGVSLWDNVLHTKAIEESGVFVDMYEKSLLMKSCFLRKVLENDCELIFSWANDPICRQNSFQSGKIPFSEHKLWFEEKLKNAKCFFYILVLSGNDIGQIRVDVTDEIGVISYAISPKYRGQGFGNIIIKLIENECMNIKELHGEVKVSNIGSCRCFEKNGYSFSEKDGIRTYIKKII